MSGHIHRADPADGVAVPRVRAVVLTGGESCFCAGADIKAMTSTGTGVLAPVERLSRVVEPSQAVVAALGQASEIAALPADAARLTKARQAFLDKRNPRFNLDLATER